MRTQRFRVDRVPPTMRTAHNSIQIVRIAMHRVLGTVVADRFPYRVLEFGRNHVLRCVHVRHFGFAEASSKAFPYGRRDVVGLSNVQAPNLATWTSQNTEKMEHLVILHAFVEILSRGERKKSANVGGTACRCDPFFRT